MTADQENYLTMSQTTFSFLSEQSSVWKSNASVAEVIAGIGAQNDNLVDLQAEQEKDHTGITDGKQTERTNLEEAINLVSNSVSYAAAMLKDAALQGVVKPGTRYLGRGSATKLIGLAKIILQTGTDALEKAAPYGLTQQMLDDLKKSLDAFVKLVNAPRIAITTAATATDLIAQGIDALHTDYDEKLDKAMVLFKMNAAFYNQYKKVRTIVHSPEHKIALTTAFTDAAGNPLPDVKVSIVNGEEKVLRNSTRKGNIRVQNLLEGDHVLVAEKPGFVSQQIPFLITGADTVRLEVKLVEG